MARPTMLTPELVTGIVTLIQHGVHPAVAAGAFRVMSSTYYEWIARGEGTDTDRLSVPIYVEFAEAVRAAEYEAESALVTLAISKVKTTADAVQLLERRFAERWQRQETVTINLRREAQRIADETGLNVDDIVSEVESILAGVR